VASEGDLAQLVAMALTSQPGSDEAIADKLYWYVDRRWIYRFGIAP
jgi:hypothetical protein